MLNGWGFVFDLKGKNVGTFQSKGTFRLDAARQSFSGPGSFEQFDLTGKQIYVEPFTATATKLPV